MRALKVGDVTDFGNFMGAVIDGSSFKTQKAAIDEANASDGKASVLVGGGYDDSDGWFVEPTVIETTDPDFRTMKEELFGPVVTAFVYDEKQLRGHARPDRRRRAVRAHRRGLRARPQRGRARAASGSATRPGNFYVNDKPTGAVVGQQPFGGARASGTNDKAGLDVEPDPLGLARGRSRSTSSPPTDYRYPFMGPEPDAGPLVARRLGRRRRSPEAQRRNASTSAIEVGDELDVPGVVVEVVRDEVQLHAPRRYAGFVSDV